MTSTDNSNLNGADHPNNDSKPLHYYKGKLKTYSGESIYFVDQRNVAVVAIRDFFINGKQVCDMRFEEIDKYLSGNYYEFIEIHAYVMESCEDVQGRNLQFPGKKQWRAKYAWIGSLPESIISKPEKVFYMPISYYTGKVKAILDNQILFGDLRNCVMVNAENFYIHGTRATSVKGLLDPFRHDPEQDTTIHAYMCKLHILTFPGHEGPEPYLPLWPKAQYTSDLWVAKFAWQGQMPPQVKEQVKRFYVLRLNEWTFSGCFPWKKSSIEWNIGNPKYQKDAQNVDDELPSNLVSVPIMPMEQEPGIMKGTYFIGDHTQALITSFSDVVAFKKENFYINGEKFRSTGSLSNFFKDRKVYLTAWVVPMKEASCIFHINVPYYAPCVWIGAIPEELKIYQGMEIQPADPDLIKTTRSPSTMVLTHFMGSLSSLSNSEGTYRCRVNSKHTVNVGFKRKAVFIQAEKFQGGLLEWRSTLEYNVWSMLAYPIPPELDTPAILQYQAVAVWQYQHQSYMCTLPVVISEAIALRERETGYMSGWIVWLDEDSGIIKTTSKSEEDVHVFFKKSALYIDGEPLQNSSSLKEMSSYYQCKVLAKPVPIRNFFGYRVSMEGELVWFGVKPNKVPSYITGAYEDEDKSPEPRGAAKETEPVVEPSSVLHSAQGVVLGTVLMTDNNDGLIVSSSNIVAFSSKDLYICGEKFSKRGESLTDLCSGRQVNVRALVVPLKQAKLVMNCTVMCEAVCAWNGEEPASLKSLEAEYNAQANKASPVEKLPSSSDLFYMLGNISYITKTMGILTCSTPSGLVKVAFWNNSVFINSALLPEDSILWKQRSFDLSDWSCFAYPVHPVKHYGHVVKYYAKAIWQGHDHHRIGKKLLDVLSSETKVPKDVTSKTSPNNLKSINGVGKPNVLGESNKRLAYNTIEDIAKDDKKFSDSEKGKKLGDENEKPTQDFYGKHMTGYVIKKYYDGGVAQWKSIQLGGFIHIEFKCKTMFVDLKPMSHKFKLTGVENRSCNFFVKPVPHHDVSGITVSLEATCGWIGKKPTNLPKPGHQELANVSLSNVHVTPIEELPEDAVLELPQSTEKSKKEAKVVSKASVTKNNSTEKLSKQIRNNELPPRKQDTVPVVAQYSHPRPLLTPVNATTTSKPRPATQFIQPTPAPTPRLTTQPTIISTKNTTTHVTQPISVPVPRPSQPIIVPVPKPTQPTIAPIPRPTQPTITPAPRTTTPPAVATTAAPTTTNEYKNSEGIWWFRQKGHGHIKGTVKGVFESMGQVEGEDGKDHYFQRECCFLFGVSLRNIELWHVLIQGDKVLYVTCDGKPGSKIENVFLGTPWLPEHAIARGYIRDWCENNLVPDGAREIIMQELEVS